MFERDREAISLIRWDRRNHNASPSPRDMKNKDKNALTESGNRFFSCLFSGFAIRYRMYPKTNGSRIVTIFGRANHNSAAGMKKMIKSKHIERRVLNEIKKITLK